MRPSKLGQPSRFYGIDFSGAKDAGRKIWIAVGAVGGRALRITDCQSATSYLGTRAERDGSLAALQTHIATHKDAAFGLDFPFGLPRDLTGGRSWIELVLGLQKRFPTPESFKQACLDAAKGKELRRCTDRVAHTPLSPYNLRLYKQTYYGIVSLLGPLVRDKRASVLPMHSLRPRRPILIEICPASWLKKGGLGDISYKGRSEEHKRGRQRILGVLMKQDHVSVAKSVQETVKENRGGDALDSLIAAYCTFRAMASGFRPRSPNPEFEVEGYVYF